MGRKKIEITPITDAVKRRNTLKKRIRGVMKKLVELNTLCGTDIMLIAINNNMDEAHPRRLKIIGFKRTVPPTIRLNFGRRIWPQPARRPK